MPIVFQQPSPVGAAGAVGAAQGAAQVRGQNLQAQIAAGNLYAQHAARMAAIEEQSAGRFQSAAMLGAQLGERGREAELDFANQRAREQAQAGIEQMQGQFLLQRQREAAQAQLRERAIAEGELTPAEEQQLARYESGMAEARRARAEGRITPAQFEEVTNNIGPEVTSLRVRRQLTIEKQQQLEIQEAQRKAGLFSAIQNANAQGAAMNWDKFKVGIDPATGDHAGWINPFDGKFIEKPKEEAAKVNFKPFDAVKAKSDAQAEADIAYPPTIDEITGKERRSDENTRYAADLWRQRRAEHEAIYGSPQARVTPPTEQQPTPTGASSQPTPSPVLNKLKEDRGLVESAKNLAYREGHLADLAWAEQMVSKYGDPANMPEDDLARYVKIRMNMKAIRALGSSLIRE